MRALVFTLASLFVTAIAIRADETSRYYRPLRPGEVPKSAASLPPLHPADGIALVIPPFMPDTLLVSEPGKFQVEPNSKVRVTLNVDPERFPSVLLKTRKLEKGEVRIGSVTKTRKIGSDKTSQAEVEFTIIEDDLTLEVKNRETSAVDSYEFEVRRPDAADESSEIVVQFLSEPGRHDVRSGRPIRVQAALVDGNKYTAHPTPTLKVVAERVIRVQESSGRMSFVQEFEFETVGIGSARLELRNPEADRQSLRSLEYELRILP